MKSRDRSTGIKSQKIIGEIVNSVEKPQKKQSRKAKIWWGEGSGSTSKCVEGDNVIWDGKQYNMDVRHGL